MVSDIVSYCAKWNCIRDEPVLKCKLQKALIQLTRKFVLRTNLCENVGVDSIEKVSEIDDSRLSLCNSKHNIKYTKAEIETFNIFYAWEYLANMYSETTIHDIDSSGFLELDYNLKKLHKIVMENTLSSRKTAAGQYSEMRRVSIWQDEVHEYPHLSIPEMSEKLISLEIRINSGIQSVKKKCAMSRYEQFLEQFKLIAEFLAEFLTIHCFCDGNGRTGILLANYLMLDIGCPFPTGLHDIHSNDDVSKRYTNILLNYGKSNDRAHNIMQLTTLLIECNWSTWRELYQLIEI